MCIILDCLFWYDAADIISWLKWGVNDNLGISDEMPS